MLAKQHCLIQAVFHSLLFETLSIIVAATLFTSSLGVFVLVLVIQCLPDIPVRSYSLTFSFYFSLHFKLTFFAHLDKATMQSFTPKGSFCWDIQIIVSDHIPCNNFTCEVHQLTYILGDLFR